MKRKRTRYIFLASVVPLCLVLIGYSSIAIGNSGERAAAPEAVDDKIVVENLKLSGRKFHPNLKKVRDHEPICLAPGWRAEWICPKCAQGEGRDLDFMVKLLPDQGLSESECGDLWDWCSENNPQFAPGGFQPPGSNNTSPFEKIEVDAPRIDGSFAQFEVSGDGLRVEGEFSIPRISGDGSLRAGPIKEGSRGYCYKLDYVLYDAETGEEVDRVDPHIVG